MKLLYLRKILGVILLIILVSGCNVELGDTQVSTEAVPTVEGTDPVPTETSIPTDQPPPSYPLAEMSFIVLVPADTPPDQAVYLSVLDEVTGLALNAQFHQMEIDDSSTIGDTRAYRITLPLSAGSIVKYRYARQAESIVVAEHTPDGEPVRYRLLKVNSPGEVVDLVSRWTDTSSEHPSGRLVGRVMDKKTQQPIPNMLITAGGEQVYSDTDGVFLIEGLRPGIHNLVVYSTDGSYDTFQQGARIEADLPTLAPVELSSRSMVDVTFIVRLPEDTPPVIPIRLAGNLSQLGNSFATLSGGISSVASEMPLLQLLPDGRFSTTLTLPSGADIHYKYTLGDGFWNAEHTQEGEFRLRNLIVPADDFIIEETVETWNSSRESSITFDVQVPQNTPAGDYVSIQFNPLFGWTEPIPMWALGENRWAYVLLSPLNLPGNVSYRYCRNDQCGTADDIATPGLYGSGRPINMGELPLFYNDKVEAWIDIGQ